jgi:hypothetical protein
MEAIIAEQGILGNGSITAARATVAAAQLRPESEIEAARASYERTRGKAREPSEPDKIVAGLGAHHLAWVLDPEMNFAVD